MGSDKRYLRLFPFLMRASRRSWVVVLLVTVFGGSFYLWYSRYGSDPNPDGSVGLSYAVAGTTCLVLAGVLYSRRRRNRKRAVGQLHAALDWHSALGIIGLLLLGMHSFGHFELITGTSALCGMIALVISGYVGRALDHFVPRLIAQEVQQALTIQGEDRLEHISQKLQALATHNEQEGQLFQTTHTDDHQRGQPMLTTWDLAYVSAEEMPQELRRSQHRPDDQKHELPGAVMPGAHGELAVLQQVQKALQRERRYRYVIRYWRVLHRVLALVTVGLTLWHIEFALQLLLPRWFHW